MNSHGVRLHRAPRRYPKRFNLASSERVRSCELLKAARQVLATDGGLPVTFMTAAIRPCVKPWRITTCDYRQILDCRDVDAAIIATKDAKLDLGGP